MEVVEKTSLLRNHAFSNYYGVKNKGESDDKLLRVSYASICDSIYIGDFFRWIRSR